ncbi:MAG: bifunctional DNA-formamidopyrimidine glycosylase/DNA-(apurinic or apyrimidinic site) lyase [Dehalococcoidales bacterium]|nr:bifunctional DNA-formamidopyrimidine glycosylase/DNA-(apurinic or apyrimidinic site) lyase [Dehalococcoidales bacterium]
MPELPEVETIKNELTPLVIGRRITGITLGWEGIVKKPSLAEFCSRLTGQVITGLRRRGKYLIFSLKSGQALIIHLKMTGSLLLNRASDEPARHVRAVLHLDDGAELRFRDPRKFGAMWLTEDAESVVAKLGPEPLTEDFSAAVLSERLARRKAPIKPLLLDQNFIAGIGNMYADESLYDAKIHPLRPAASLSQKDITRLHKAIQEVLWAAIGNKGASVENYFRPGGELGTAHFEFRVAHGLGGKLCPRCGTPIERIVVRNRGSYFCPKCQPYP